MPTDSCLLVLFTTQKVNKIGIFIATASAMVKCYGIMAIAAVKNMADLGDGASDSQFNFLRT